MFQVIDRAPSTGDKFARAFANLGKASQAIPQQMMQQEKTRQQEAESDAMAKMLGLEGKGIRDRDFLSQILKGQQEGQLQKQKYAFEGSRPQKAEKNPLAEKKYQEAQESSLLANDVLAELDHLDELTESLSGFKGVGKLLNPFGSAEASELEALGTTVIQPILKILNPAGPIAQKKLELILKTHSPKPWDSAETAKGKINSIRRFVQKAIGRNNALMEMYSSGNLSPKHVKEYESSILKDAEEINSEAPASKTKERPALTTFD